MKFAYISTIIASPTIKIRFNMFPIPNSLKMENNVTAIEIIRPLLELPKTKEDRKKRKAKRLIKNKNTNNIWAGLVK